MTDEEKAEVYAEDYKTKDGRSLDYCDIKQAYLDGLTEGRKELEQWKQEWQDAQIKANEEGFTRTTIQIKYKELEKENKELKKDKEWLDNTNNEQTEVILKLNEQIDQLSNDNHVLKTAFITQEEQIEKMKSFVKSMYEANKNDAYCKEYLGTILNEWELAE